MFPFCYCAPDDQCFCGECAPDYYPIILPGTKEPQGNCTTCPIEGCKTCGEIYLITNADGTTHLDAWCLECDYGWSLQNAGQPSIKCYECAEYGCLPGCQCEESKLGPEHGFHEYCRGPCLDGFVQVAGVRDPANTGSHDPFLQGTCAQCPALHCAEGFCSCTDVQAYLALDLTVSKST